MNSYAMKYIDKSNDTSGPCSVKRRVNSTPNNKTLDCSKLQRFENDKINVAIMTISVFHRVENIVEKEENAGYQHFLLFPKCFQETSSSRSLKVGIVW